MRDIANREVSVYDGGNFGISKKVNDFEVMQSTISNMKESMNNLSLIKKTEIYNDPGVEKTINDFKQLSISISDEKNKNDAAKLTEKEIRKKENSKRLVERGPVARDRMSGGYLCQDNSKYNLAQSSHAIKKKSIKQEPEIKQHEKYNFESENLLCNPSDHRNYRHNYNVEFSNREIQQLTRENSELKVLTCDDVRSVLMPIETEKKIERDVYQQNVVHENASKSDLNQPKTESFIHNPNIEWSSINKFEPYDYNYTKYGADEQICDNFQSNFKPKIRHNNIDIYKDCAQFLSHPDFDVKYPIYTDENKNECAHKDVLSNFCICVNCCKDLGKNFEDPIIDKPNRHLQSSSTDLVKSRDTISKDTESLEAFISCNINDHKTKINDSIYQNLDCFDYTISNLQCRHENKTIIPDAFELASNLYTRNTPSRSPPGNNKDDQIVQKSFVKHVVTNDYEASSYYSPSNINYDVSPPELCERVSPTKFKDELKTLLDVKALDDYWMKFLLIDNKELLEISSEGDTYLMRLLQCHKQRRFFREEFYCLCEHLLLREKRNSLCGILEMKNDTVKTALDLMADLHHDDDDLLRKYFNEVLARLQFSEAECAVGTNKFSESKISG